jgi:transposase
MISHSVCHVNYIQSVKCIMSISVLAATVNTLFCSAFDRAPIQMAPSISAVNSIDNEPDAYIIRLTPMKRSKPTPPVDSKAQALRQQGALHPNPEAVQDEAFRRGEFFDPRDVVQVRYEMLRRHQVDGQAVTEVSAAFGVSRQAFYTTEAAFGDMGISGLLPRRRGPKHAHKCTDEILDFVEQWRADPSNEGGNVTKAVRKRFRVSINPRSIERALMRRKKKR